jgi:hypothetical protein
LKDYSKGTINQIGLESKLGTEKKFKKM